MFKHIPQHLLAFAVIVTGSTYGRLKSRWTTLSLSLDPKHIVPFIFSIYRTTPEFSHNDQETSTQPHVFPQLTPRPIIILIRLISISIWIRRPRLRIQILNPINIITRLLLILLPFLIFLLLLFILLLLFMILLILLLLRLIPIPTHITQTPLSLRITLHPLSRIIHHLNILVLAPSRSISHTKRPSTSLIPTINIALGLLRFTLASLGLRIRFQLLFQACAERIEFKFCQRVEDV